MCYAPLPDLALGIFSLLPLAYFSLPSLVLLPLAYFSSLCLVLLRQSQNSKGVAQYLLFGLSVTTVVLVPWNFLYMLVLTVFMKFG